MIELVLHQPASDPTNQETCGALEQSNKTHPPSVMEYIQPISWSSFQFKAIWMHSMHKSGPHMDSINLRVSQTKLLSSVSL